MNGLRDPLEGWIESARDVYIGQKVSKGPTGDDRRVPLPNLLKHPEMITRI